MLLNKVEDTVDWTYRNRKAIRAMVAKLLDFDYLEALGADVTEIPEGPVEQAEIYEEWWFWTIIGVAVVGVGAGVGLGLGLNQDEPPPYSKDGSGALVLRF